MKRIIYLITVSIFICLLLFSCGNNSMKNNIIGDWYFSVNLFGQEVSFCMTLENDDTASVVMNDGTSYTGEYICDDETGIITIINENGETEDVFELIEYDGQMVLQAHSDAEIVQELELIGVNVYLFREKAESEDYYGELLKDAINTISNFIL